MQNRKKFDDDAIWTDKCQDFAIQKLAEMYPPSEITDFMLDEFKADWLIETVTDEGKRRMLLIRRWAYNKIRNILYDNRLIKIQKEIKRRRLIWKNGLTDNIREANKVARIADYARIKRLCIASSDYRGAIRALLAIARELGELTIGITAEIDHRIHEITGGEEQLDHEIAEYFAILAGSEDGLPADIAKALESVGIRTSGTSIQKQLKSLPKNSEDNGHN